MAQEDKIKRELDMIGIVLAKLMNMLMNKPDERIDGLNKMSIQLKSELDIDLQAILDMKHQEALNLLINTKKFTIEHLRVFANLLKNLARNNTEGNYTNLLNAKALAIYEYISANGKGTMYFDVELNIKELRNRS